MHETWLDQESLLVHPAEGVTLWDHGWPQTQPF